MILVEHSYEDEDLCTERLVAKPEGYVTVDEVIDTIVAELSDTTLNAMCGCNDYTRALEDVVKFVKTFKKDAANE